MNNVLKIIFSLLGLFLPLHGGISVFFPGNFIFWKEILLILIFFIVIEKEIRSHFLNKNNNFIQKTKEWKKSLNVPEKISFGILFLSLLLTIISPDQSTALEAARYLGLPFIVFLCVSRLIPYYKNQKNISFKDYFIHFFILGCIFSISFGTLIQFKFGLSFVQNFYSNTISSWVPGQTLPIWHEVNGLVRMQGFSSGPVEFSHLLLAGLVIIPSLWFKKITKKILYFVFFLGIFLSYSRGAIIGGSVILFFNFFRNYFQNNKENSSFLLPFRFFPKIKKNMGILFPGIFLLIIFSSIFLFKNNNFIQKIITRTSTSDHFTRPIEAFKIGLKSPLRGNLGLIGPAARKKNMKEHNSDKALIAENIFIDYFAQLGIIGGGLFLLFWKSMYSIFPKKFLGFFWASMIVFSFATLFDMTPISISYMILFAFFLRFDTKKQTT